MFLENEAIVDKTKGFFEQNPGVVFSRSDLLDLYHTRLNKEHLKYHSISNNDRGIREIISLLRDRYPDLMLIVSQEGYKLTTDINEKIQECFERVEIAKNRLKGDMIDTAKEKAEVELENWEAEYNYWSLKG